MTTPIWKGCAAGNYRSGRPTGMRPEAIVIHISTGSAASADRWFNDPAAKVSAHYLVAKNGEVHQYVQENDTAFHAGTVVQPTWQLIKKGVNPNFYTIGIEHEGAADDVWPPEQLAVSAQLVQEIAARWKIPLDTYHVIGHHEIRATKPCPGCYITIPMVLSALPHSATQAVEIPQSGTTTAALRIREGASTQAAILQVLPAGAAVDITGAVNGTSVNDNDLWYKLSHSGYVWSGAITTRR